MTDNRKETSMRTRLAFAMLLVLLPFAAACHPRMAVLIPPLNIENPDHPDNKPKPNKPKPVIYEMTCIRDPQDPTRCEMVEWIPPGE